MGDVVRCFLVHDLLDSGFAVPALREIGKQMAGLTLQSREFSSDAVWFTYRDSSDWIVQYHHPEEEVGSPASQLPENWLRKIPLPVTNLHLVIMERIYTEIKDNMNKLLKL